MIFASTPPKNDDPQPFADPGGRDRSVLQYSFWGNYSRQRNPRPEYDQPRAHDANRALLILREQLQNARDGFEESEMQDWLEWLDDGHGLALFTPDECVHARRVIALWLEVFVP